MHGLSDYRGKWLLLYFYPKDDTPGCTREACLFRDNFPKFSKLNVEVIGISADTVKSHKKFAEKYELPFTLLSDEKKEVLKKYSVWAKKKFPPAPLLRVKLRKSKARLRRAGMGKEYMGILRTSFLINPEGKIFKIYENVKPDTHAKEVLRDMAGN